MVHLPVVSLASQTADDRAVEEGSIAGGPGREVCVLVSFRVNSLCLRNTRITGLTGLRPFISAGSKQLAAGLPIASQRGSLRTGCYPLDGCPRRTASSYLPFPSRHLERGDRILPLCLCVILSDGLSTRPLTQSDKQNHTESVCSSVVLKLTL